MSTRDIIVVEDFYDDWQAVRTYALRQPYYYPYQDDESVARGVVRPTWMATRFKQSRDCPFKSSDRLICALETLTGDPIDREHWNRDYPVDNSSYKPRADETQYPRSCLWNCCFHCKFSSQQLGAGVHSHTDRDPWNGAGVDGWAGLIYLAADAPLRNGLKIWRNVRKDHQFDWMTAPENWELLDDLANVPNRLILARGRLPHSGSSGWGIGLADGRLFQTFFFKVKEPRPCRSVRIERLC